MFEGDLSADIWSVEQERNHWFSFGGAVDTDIDGISNIGRDNDK